MLIDKYIKFVENFLTDFFKFILENRYEKSLVKPFIDKYIDVRYYNESDYSNYPILDRINRDLKKVAKELILSKPKYEEDIKKIFSLFAYVLYIDDCSNYTSLTSLTNTMVSDLGIVDSESLKNLMSNFVKQRKEFIKNFDNKEFSIHKTRLARNIKKVNLDEDCKIPLYSEDAIKRAYSSGTVFENRQYLLLLMLSGDILKSIIDLDYNETYIVDFPETLFGKDKKIGKYLKALDNKMIRPKISLLIGYEAYTKNKELINSFIRDGYSISVVLDEKYDENIKVLDLFSNVLVYEKYDYCDIILDNRENIKAKIICM